MSTANHPKSYERFEPNADLEPCPPVSLTECHFCTDLTAKTFDSKYETLQESIDDQLGFSISNPRDRHPVIHIQNPAKKVTILCLVLMTLMGIGYTMFFAKAIILPIIFAFLLNFFLSPIIRKLERMRIPPPVGAIIVLMLAVIPFLAVSLLAYYPAKDWIARAPVIFKDIETKVRPIRAPLDEFNKTSEKLSQLVNGEEAEEEEQDVEIPLGFGRKVRIESDENPIAAAAKDTKKPRPVPVQLEEPSLTGQFINTTSNVAIGVFLTFVLLYFLLAAGDRGLEKMVELMPTWSAKRNIVELTREIQNSISDYLVTTTMINIGLGFVIGTGLGLIGLPNPVLWGVMACFLNFLPFIGCFVGAAIVFLVALVSFDTVSYALLAPAIYLGANLLEGNFVTPTLIGRSISLHPVWLMFFFSIVTWIWGVPGAVVAVPMLAIGKIICDHIEPLHPLGKFLGR